MKVDVETVKLGVEKKYTEFSDSIKEILNTKLNNNSVYKNYNDTLDKMNSQKSVFVEFNKNSNES